MFFIADHPWLQLVKSVLICCVCLRCLRVASYKAITQKSVAVWAPLLGIEFWVADRPYQMASVLRLPHRQKPRPTATRRTATLSGSSKYCACQADRPRPTATRRAATLSGGSKYCACHANRSCGPRRPGAPLRWRGIR